MASSSNPSIQDLETDCANLIIEEEANGGFEFDVGEEENDSFDSRWSLVGKFLSNRAMDLDFVENQLANLWKPNMGIGPEITGKEDLITKNKGIDGGSNVISDLEGVIASHNSSCNGIDLTNSGQYIQNGGVIISDQKRRRVGVNSLVGPTLMNVEVLMVDNIGPQSTEQELDQSLAIGPKEATMSIQIQDESGNNTFSGRQNEQEEESSLPWCMLGDFNNVVSQADKRGGRPYPSWLVEGFQKALADCNLVDIDLCGYQFTWERGRGTERWVEDIFDCYSNIFQASLVDLHVIVDCITPSITQSQNTVLMESVIMDEVKATLFDMHPDKAPGPDGMTSAFYQKFWSVVGSDVVDVVQLFFNSNSIPQGLNDTNLVLIPKKKNPVSMGDLKPIALCNILYKAN
uniref:Uncharacterized protein n=1 Tax=Cannabis sativa TaxID=3483 RepID=A0A803NH35_CANSA